MEYIITGVRAVATASRMISMDSDSSAIIGGLPITLIQQEVLPDGCEFPDLVRPRLDDIVCRGAGLEAFAEPRGTVHDVDGRLREFVFVRFRPPLEPIASRVSERFDEGHAG